VTAIDYCEPPGERFPSRAVASRTVANEVEHYSSSIAGIDIEAIRRAESLGFDSVWTAEAYGNDAVTSATWRGVWRRKNSSPPVAQRRRASGSLMPRLPSFSSALSLQA